MMMPMGWIWLLLLIGGGLLLWRAFTNKQQEIPTPQAASQETAHDLLLKEFAKGTITEEEYLAKKKYME